MKLVHCPLTAGLLKLVQRGGDWAAPQWHMHIYNLGLRKEGRAIDVKGSGV